MKPARLLENSQAVKESSICFVKPKPKPTKTQTNKETKKSKLASFLIIFLGISVVCLNASIHYITSSKKED